MPDEIIEVSKREPIPQDELLQEMGKIVLHPPEKQTLTEELNEPLLTMTRAIHSEFDQISKSILLSQNQIDVEAEAFELQMKRVAGGLKAHLAFLKKSEEKPKKSSKVADLKKKGDHK